MPNEIQEQENETNIRTDVCEPKDHTIEGCARMLISYNLDELNHVLERERGGLKRPVALELMERFINSRMKLFVP